MSPRITSTYTADQAAAIQAAADRIGKTRAGWQKQVTLGALNPGPVVTPPPPEKWYDHMGVSVTGAKLSDIPQVLKYGRWYRMGWESTWGVPIDFIDEARHQNCKVLACLQDGRVGHRYEGWDLARMAQFADWCVRIADLGVEVIEVGNEMNNPTFNSARDASQTTAALLTAVVADAVHSFHPQVRIISNGWSPMGGDAAQYPQVAMGQMLRTASALNLPMDGRLYGCGYHPYELNHLPSWDPGAHPGWNACWWVPQAYASMVEFGVRGPVCMTEYGKAGTADQADWATSYHEVFANYRNAGVPVDLMMWHTLRDGQSILPGEDPRMGILTAANEEKPVGAVLRAAGTKPW